MLCGFNLYSMEFGAIEKKETSEIKIKAEINPEKEKFYEDPIVTKIEPFTNFYIAEDYHKNYFERNKDTLYCNLVISPKIHKLLEKYGSDVKEKYKKLNILHF